MPLIYELIPRVMAAIGSVSKDRRNEQQKYAFRGIEDFYLAAHPVFVTHGVFCVPEVMEHTSTAFDKTNEFGKTTTWRHVTIKVKHQFFASDGSHVDVVTMGEGLDNSDKATNKAMSGAMKYALIELFTVPTQDVEDSDRTSPETGRPRSGPPAPVTTKPIPVSGPVKKTAAVDPANPVIKGHSPVQPQKAADTDALADALMRKLADKTPPPETLPDKDAAPSRDDSGAIDLPRQKALHRAFREAIPGEDARKHADTFLQDWLKHQGYFGADGKGTTKTIPAMLFEEVKRAAVKYAAELGA